MVGPTFGAFHAQKAFSALFSPGLIDFSRGFGITEYKCAVHTVRTESRGLMHRSYPRLWITRREPMAETTNTLRKADLAKAVAEELHISAGEAEKAVTLTGFGTFDVADQAGREGRNPATGAAIQIAARKRVRFKLGSELDAIR